MVLKVWKMKLEHFVVTLVRTKTSSVYYINRNWISFASQNRLKRILLFLWPVRDCKLYTLMPTHWACRNVYNKLKTNEQSISVRKDDWGSLKTRLLLSRVQLRLSCSDPVRTNSGFILTATRTKPLINTLLLHTPPGTRIL